MALPSEQLPEEPPTSKAVRPGLQCEVHPVELHTHHLLEKHHAEVLEKLQSHEEILLKVLGCAHSHGALAAEKVVQERAPQVGERERRSSEREQQQDARVAFDVEQPVAAHAPNVIKRSRSRAHGSYTFTPKLFSTFTQFDLQLKEGAANVDADQASRVLGLDRRSMRSSGINDSWLKRFVSSASFDIFFASLVVTNAIFIGVEVQDNLHNPNGDSLVLKVIRNFYTALFTVEILLRIAAHQRDFFCSPDNWKWNMVDMLLVLCSLWEAALEIMSAMSEDGGQRMTGFSGLRTVRIVRITRLVRVAKLGRILRFVMALRTLIQSIIYTLKSLIWALVLLALIIYFFAIIFTQAVGDSRLDANAQQSPEADRYFNSLLEAMLSLFMCISGGVSWENVIYPLWRLSPAWVVVFVFYVSFTYFAVLNVVTGVFCQSAIDSAQSDHTMVMQSILANKEAHIEKIKFLFSEIDAEERGLITYKMFEEKVGDQAVKAYFESMDLDVWDAWSFFKLLDLDAGCVHRKSAGHKGHHGPPYAWNFGQPNRVSQSGAVEIEEFLMGCLRLRGSARAIDIAKLIHDQAWLLKNQSHFWTFVEVQLQELKQQLRHLAPTAVGAGSPMGSPTSPRPPTPATTPVSNA